MTVPFITECDKAHSKPGGDEPPALIFNPAATVNGLLPLALSRASRLNTWVFAIACEESGELSQFCSSLQPLAREIELIINQAMTVAHQSAT
jgi:hypothetical protein